MGLPTYKGKLFYQVRGISPLQITHATSQSACREFEERREKFSCSESEVSDEDCYPCENGRDGAESC